MVIIRHPTSTITAEVHMASDISTGERNQDKFDDDYLRSIQEGLEKMLEELLKEEE